MADSWQRPELADEVANALLLLERSLAYAPYFCLNRILAVLDELGTMRSAWIYASLYIIVLKAYNFTQVYRMWDV